MYFDGKRSLTPAASSLFIFRSCEFMRHSTASLNQMPRLDAQGEECELICPPFNWFIEADRLLCFARDGPESRRASSRIADST